MKGTSLYTSRKPIIEVDKRTLKQKLATTYNFLLFRATGTYLAKPFNYEVPFELDIALASYARERKNLIKILKKQKVRDKFMKMNLKPKLKEVK